MTFLKCPQDLKLFRFCAQQVFSCSSILWFLSWFILKKWFQNALTLHKLDIPWHALVNILFNTKLWFHWPKKCKTLECPALDRNADPHLVKGSLPCTVFLLDSSSSRVFGHWSRPRQGTGDSLRLAALLTKLDKNNLFQRRPKSAQVLTVYSSNGGDCSLSVNG